MTEVFQIFQGLSLMILGFILVACLYRFNNKDWNGYADKQKLLVSFIIMAIVCVLLVTVPETSEMIKKITALDIDIQTSKKGFVSFGFALSLYLNMHYKARLK